MATERKGAVNWKGNATDLAGPELKKGDKAPADWTATANDMSPVKGADLAGKVRIVCAVPSIDTPVCDREVRQFNQDAAALPGVEVYTVSMDLPFAAKRWCAAAGIDKVKTLSDYKDRSFGPAWGVYAPAKGLFARAVFVVGKDDTIQHAEYVSEVGNEPNYKTALDAARIASGQ